MHPTITRAPKHTRPSWQPVVAVVALALVAAMVFAGVSDLVRPPDVVERIEIRNETADLVDVHAFGDGDGDVVPVAIAEPNRRAVGEDIIDQGDRWTFVVEASGRPVTTIRTSRASLARAGWVVTVPADPQPGGLVESG